MDNPNFAALAQMFAPYWAEILADESGAAAERVCSELLEGMTDEQADALWECWDALLEKARGE
jgi:hypothetical protein